MGFPSGLLGRMGAIERDFYHERTMEEHKKKLAFKDVATNKEPMPSGKGADVANLVHSDIEARIQQ